MKLKEKFNDLKSIFEVIKWWKNNKSILSAAVDRVSIISGDIAKLKVDVIDIKTILAGNKESNN